jgi:hypothetical protein
MRFSRSFDVYMGGMAVGKAVEMYKFNEEARMTIESPQVLSYIQLRSLRVSLEDPLSCSNSIFQILISNVYSPSPPLRLQLDNRQQQ